MSPHKKHDLPILICRQRILCPVSMILGKYDTGQNCRTIRENLHIKQSFLMIQEKRLTEQSCRTIREIYIRKIVPMTPERH